MSRRSGYARDLEYKGEKYVRVRVEVEDDRIKEIYIRGDFFCYPEEAIEVLERRLRGAEIEKIQEIYMETMRDVELLGLGKEELLNLILEASKCL